MVLVIRSQFRYFEELAINLMKGIPENACLIFVAILMSASKTFAQFDPYAHPSSLGVNFILNDFAHKELVGDFSVMDAGLSLSYINGMSPHFDYAIQLSGSFPDSISKKLGKQDRSLMFQGDIHLRARVLGRPAAIHPFLLSGAGLFSYRRHSGLYGSLGAGVEFNYKDVYLTTSFQYRPALLGSINSYCHYSIGITGIIGKSKKRHPQSTVDPAPQIALRDRDGDGILDTADRCPDRAGLAQFQGCPDSDRDGIEDGRDSCPIIAGIERYQGCPIPDTDKDGLDDESDRCVTMPGPILNKGCPEKEIQREIDLAARNILFQSGSASLLPSSFAHLDSIARLLRDRPGLKLSIEGHTDGDGSMAKNQLLSENRAKAVKEYLVRKEIDAARLEAQGFGEERPIMSNDTAEGKRANRRVELIVKLQ